MKIYRWLKNKIIKKKKKFFRYSFFGSLIIHLKFYYDKRRLPLNNDHKDLYITIQKFFYWELARFPNIFDCKDYNDKVQWLKLFDQDVLLIDCADKLAVKSYIRQKIGGQYLPETYQIGERWSDINFSRLPNSFVLKTNHDSGTVVLVGDKNKFDYVKTEEQFKKSLSSDYGVELGEWHYQHIKPKIFAEEYLGEVDCNPPADFKFHCVGGELAFVQYIYDRGSITKERILDGKGFNLKINLDHDFQYDDEDYKISEEFIEAGRIAKELSLGFKYLRVDIFIVERKIYVGELTFFPKSGMYHGDGQKVLGDFLDFSRSSTKKLYQ